MEDAMPVPVPVVPEALVVAADVAFAPPSSILAGEPITTARLREFLPNGTTRDRVVRILGGRTKNGGFARLAGHVVPIVGARVRVDLVAPQKARWIPNTPAGTWDASALPVTFVLALPRSRDLGADAMGEIAVAARTWGRPACTSFRARFGDERTIAPADDGINAVFFHDDAWPAELVAGALGQTIVHVDGNGKLHDADIHINGADFRFSSFSKNANAGSGTQDIRSVLVHEIGHALGLGHSNDARATMNASGSGLRWRSLEKDDVDGVCALYPGVGDLGCDGAAAADPCPLGFVCVAGSCQRPGDKSDVCSPCNPELAGTCEAAGDEARCVDIGESETAGRVCGRSCARDSDCGSGGGAGFACRPTTEAGDLQCVSLDGCKNGANTCSTDADCTPSLCRGGACVGPPASVTADAGAASDGGSSDAGPIAGGGADCDCRAAGSRSSSSFGGTAIAIAIVCLSLARRRIDP